MSGAQPCFPHVIAVESWREHSWLRAGFSTRQGGGSRVYGEADLNLGWTDSDSPAIVAQNRERFVTAAGADESFRLVTLRQFHSSLVRHVDSSHTSLHTPGGKSRLRGDGLVTTEVGLLLGIQTADCVPVLVADIRKRIVAGFHAGWRGTLGRIVQQGIGDFLLRYGSQLDDLVAAIGPCIRQCCLEVGSKVHSAFESQFVYGEELFTATDGDGHTHLDLVTANRQQLLHAGVPQASISVVGDCTACSRTESGRRKYFSHRAERGFTGRMMSVIGIARG